MRLRFYIDPATGEPHILNHAVDAAEVEDILDGPVDDIPGREGARVAIGVTSAGRWLKVVYVVEPDGGQFVITAYVPSARTVRAIRRRMKKR